MGEPALKVRHGGEGSSLREAFESYLLPTIKRRSKSTIQQYYNSLGKWEEFGTDSGTISTAVDMITDDMLADFSEWMDASGFAGSTFNKTWKRLRAILRKLGPPVAGNPQGIGLIERVPYVEQQEESARSKQIVTLEALDAVYRACDDAKWPNYDLPAAIAWRTLLLLLFTVGPRTGDAIFLKASTVHLTPECPERNSTVKSQHGWLRYMPRKTKRYKRWLTVPINEPLAQHLALLLPVANKDRVFPFGNATKKWKEQRELIFESARLRYPTSEVKDFPLIDLRTAANISFNQLKTGFGKWFLGHAAHGVNETYYDYVLPTMVELVNQREMPPAFTTLLAKPIERQLRLF